MVGLQYLGQLGVPAARFRKCRASSTSSKTCRASQAAESSSSTRFPVLLDAPFAVGLALQQPFLRLLDLCSCCIHIVSSRYGAGKVGSHSHMSRKNLSRSCA